MKYLVYTQYKKNKTSAFKTFSTVFALKQYIRTQSKKIAARKIFIFNADTLQEINVVEVKH